MGRKLNEVEHCTTPCLVILKNKALGVLVRMVKIMQVWGRYEIKIFEGKLKRLNEKNKAICKRMNN